MKGQATSTFMKPTEEEHLLCVGKSIALLWPHMPDAMREAILNQAETLSYRPSVFVVREQLRTFLETYSAGERDHRNG